MVYIILVEELGFIVFLDIYCWGYIWVDSEKNIIEQVFRDEQN